MNGQEQRSRIVLNNNDVTAARLAAEKSLALTAMPRRRRMWGLRLYVKDTRGPGLMLPLVPSKWHSYSTGGLYRYTSKEAAQTYGLPTLRNTGDWRAEKVPWWLAAYDSFMWLLVYSRRRR